MKIIFNLIIQEENIMLKTNVKNIHKKQFEMSYIIYMMIGSYFSKCHASDFLETKLRMYYKEIPEKVQVKIEKDVDKEFVSSFPDVSSLKDLRTRFRSIISDNYAYAIFETGICDLLFKIDTDGNYQMKILGQAA